MPPLLPDQRKVDAAHLRILAILHYVCAGLAVLALAFIALHWALMSTFLNPEMMKDVEGGPPPEEFFAFFRWFYLFGGGFFLGGMVVNLVSARCLQLRRGRTFSLVVAGLNCLVVPVGSLLGIFTLVVLLRPTVLGLYEERAGASVSAAPPAPESRADAHLRLLVIGHWVKAGVSLVNVIMMTLQSGMTRRMLVMGEDAPPFVTGIIGTFYLAIGAYSLAAAILNAAAAHALRRRIHPGFCRVVAGVNLLSMPLGTALGVFTFVVLGRNDVKSLYAGGS